MISALAIRTIYWKSSGLSSLSFFVFLGSFLSVGVSSFCFIGDGVVGLSGLLLSVVFSCRVCVGLVFSSGLGSFSFSGIFSGSGGVDLGLFVVSATGAGVGSGCLGLGMGCFSFVFSCFSLGCFSSSA